ncbi:MAG: fumarylacetoacetate hydrolase family protein [Eubacteriales bacterium]|nr:fumarylacetoacetate hydrolase family protein [Eubacteriales bacterium]
MKLCNILVDGACHLAVETARGVVDMTAAGCPLTMDEVIAGADRAALAALAADESLPVVAEPVWANVVDTVGKLVCVGLNYVEHARKTNHPIPEYPVLFSKFANALVPAGASVALPAWETTYDYEAELVIVIGKAAWGVSEAEALEHVFGYTCGNDLSCRDSQSRSGQWLIGKTMPGFGPCGPVIVTADEFDIAKPHTIRSYVNGERRQDSLTDDMIFDCAKIVSYASHYIALEPGDLIFTGTPSGVALEKKDEPGRWLKPGDVVDIEIGEIGTLRNTMA